MSNLSDLLQQAIDTGIAGKIEPTPHKWAEVIKAWADGKMIQSRPISSDDRIKYEHWEDWGESSSGYISKVPPFNRNDFEWRVKPEQKIGWILILDNGATEVTATNSKHYPNQFIYPTREAASKVVSDRNHMAFEKGVAIIQITYTEGEGL